MASSRSRVVLQQAWAKVVGDIVCCLSVGHRHSPQYRSASSANLVSCAHLMWKVPVHFSQTGILGLASLLLQVGQVVLRGLVVGAEMAGVCLGVGVCTLDEGV